MKLAAALGVGHLVEHVGRVPIDRVADEMRKADVGISCHRGGRFGDLYFSTKIVEYLTQGLAVVSSRTNTINKYLPDSSVFYFEAGNEAALADAIRFMWQNPAEVLRRLRNARELLSRLSWQREKGAFLAFYAELVNETGLRGRRAEET